MGEDMGTCGWIRGSWLFGEAQCEEPAIRAQVMGCQHEHITPPMEACGSCADLVAAKAAEGKQLCTQCRTAGTDGIPMVLLSDEPLSAQVSG